MEQKIAPTPLNDDDKAYRQSFVDMREALRMTKQELANELGMSVRSVHFYESGERIIPQRVRKTMELLHREHSLRQIVRATEVASA